MGRKPLPSEHGRSQAARLISGSVGTPPLYHSVSHQEGPRSRDATERSSPIIFSVRPQLILPGVGPAEPALLHSTQTWDAADWTCAVHCPVGRKSIDHDIDRAVLTNSNGVLVRVSGEGKATVTLLLSQLRISAGNFSRRYAADLKLPESYPAVSALLHSIMAT